MHVRRYRLAVWCIGPQTGVGINWFRDQLMHIATLLERERIDLKTVTSNSPADIPKIIARRQVDGLILQGIQPTKTCLHRLQRLPSVWFMTRSTPDYPGDFVEPNNRENARLAFSYLQSRGHRRLAVVNIGDDHPTLRERIDTFASLAVQNGELVALSFQPEPEPSHLRKASIEEGLRELVKEYQRLPARPTGLYLPSDHYCGAFLRLMRQQGFSLGEHFDIVLGNFNPLITQNLDYQPAAIDVHMPMLAEQAVRHVLWRINHPGYRGRVSVKVSPSIVEGDA